MACGRLEIWHHLMSVSGPRQRVIACREARTHICPNCGGPGDGARVDGEARGVMRSRSRLSPSWRQAQAGQCRCSPGRGVSRSVSLMAPKIRSHPLSTKLGSPQIDYRNMYPLNSSGTILIRPDAIRSSTWAEVIPISPNSSILKPVRLNLLRIAFCRSRSARRNSYRISFIALISLIVNFVFTTTPPCRPMAEPLDGV